MTKRKSKSSSSEKQLKRVKVEANDGPDEYVLFSNVLKSITKLEDDGRRVDAQFKKLPPKKVFPDYYVEIETPVSLHEIKDKVNKRQYSTIDEFVEDFRVMHQNAITYNEQGSEIANDAETIYEHVRQHAEDYKLWLANRSAMLEVLDTMEQYKTGDGRVLSDWFIVEPSAQDYPDYREVVKEPMSLTTARARVNEGAVKTMQEFKDMCQLIFTNSKTYNTEESQVYVDTGELEDYFHKTVEKIAASNSNDRVNNTKVKLSVKNTPEPDAQDNSGEVTPQALEQVEAGDEMQVDNNLDQDDELPGSGVVVAEEEIQEPEVIRSSVPDKVTHRAPGKTLDDALIASVSLCSTLPPATRYAAQKPTQAPNYSDIFQLNVLASKTRVVQSHAFTLPPYHHTITAHVLLNKSLLNRYHTVTLNLNQHKLMPTSTTNTNSWEEEKPPKSKYEMKLLPGLNQIEVVCQAAPPSSRRLSSLQPQQLNPDETESETFTFWAQLLRG